MSKPKKKFNKYCNRCGNLFRPYSKFEKLCEGCKYKNQHHRRKKIEEINVEELKKEEDKKGMEGVCVVCGEKSKSKKSHFCKECFKKRYKEYNKRSYKEHYQKNKKEILKKQKERYQKNKTSILNLKKGEKENRAKKEVKKWKKK